MTSQTSFANLKELVTALRTHVKSEFDQAYGGIQIEMLNASVKPVKEGQFNVCQITLKVTGDWANLKTYRLCGDWLKLQGLAPYKPKFTPIPLGPDLILSIEFLL